MRTERWIAEYRPEGHPEVRQFVVDYHSDDQFILNAAAWLRNMWGSSGTISIRHQNYGTAGWLDVPEECFEYTLAPSEPDAHSLYAVPEVDSNHTVMGKQETSRKAALAKYPRSGTQRFRVLTALARTATGMTREELEHVLGLTGNSVHPRVLELIAGGWVFESAETRKTRANNDAVVLRVTEKGWDEYSRREVSAA